MLFRSDFKTDFYKIPSQMARIFLSWDKYKNANIEGEELQSVLNTVHAVKNGEIADLKKFKLPKDNPLFIKNELNKIANLDGYYLETLKKPMGDQGEIVREARRKLINLGSFADIKKFAPEPDEKERMTLIARFAKDEINLSNDEILELILFPARRCSFKSGHARKTWHSQQKKLCLPKMEQDGPAISGKGCLALGFAPAGLESVLHDATGQRDRKSVV